MLLAEGTLLQNRYKIVRQIAQGGMGAVYKAKDQTLGKRVALKQMLHNNQQAQEAFKREGRILAKLSHPALPDVSHYFVQNNSQYLVMQYIPGDDLKKSLVKQGHAFPIEQVLDWADQLLDVLEYLHGEQPPIIHRDIKPANIKLSPQGKIILLDFGISKGGQIYTNKLQNGGASVYGYTEKYAPPEQIGGTGTDERSDLYSLGVTLYELLTNKEPIPALSHPPVPNRRSLSQQNDDPQSFDNLVKNNANLPVGILEVLACAMALDSNERPSNAKQMREMLQRVSRSHAQATFVPTGPLTDVSDDRQFSSPSLWRSRLAVLTMGVVGIVLLLLISRTILFRTERVGNNGHAEEESVTVAGTVTVVPPTITQSPTPTPPAPTIVAPTEIAIPPTNTPPVSASPTPTSTACQPGQPDPSWPTLRILQTEWDVFVPGYDDWFDKFAKDWGCDNEVNVIVDHIRLFNMAYCLEAEMAEYKGETPNFDIESCFNQQREGQEKHDLIEMVLPPHQFASDLVDLTQFIENELSLGEPARVCRDSSSFIDKENERKYIGLCSGWVPELSLYRRDLWGPVGPETYQELLEGGREIKGHTEKVAHHPRGLIESRGMAWHGMQLILFL